MADNTDYRLESETAGSKFDWEIFKRLWVFVKPYKGLFIISLVFLGLATGLQLSVPYFTKIAIDNYMSQDYTYSVSRVEISDSYKTETNGKTIWLKKRRHWQV